MSTTQYNGPVFAYGGGRIKTFRWLVYTWYLVYTYLRIRMYNNDKKFPEFRTAAVSAAGRHYKSPLKTKSTAAHRRGVNDN